VKVVGMLTTEVSDNFSSIVTRVMNLKPDVVYFASLAGQAGPFFRQARAAGYTGAFLTIDSSPALAEQAGPLLTEGGGAYYIDTIAPVEAFPGTTQFVKDFDNRYGSAPHLFSGQAYDAAGICLKAIEEASKATGGELPTRAEVAKAIRALVDYNGITGTYNFNKKGDPTVAKYFVFKVTAADAASWTQNPVIATFEIAPPK
jgi:branched-chain amino acid transport system substrate-binding protein